MRTAVQGGSAQGLTEMSFWSLSFLVISIIINELHYRKKGKYVSDRVVRVSKIIAMLAVIVGAVFGILTIGKWNITPKMLVLGEHFYSTFEFFGL